MQSEVSKYDTSISSVHANESAESFHGMHASGRPGVAVDLLLLIGQDWNAR